MGSDPLNLGYTITVDPTTADAASEAFVGRELARQQTLTSAQIRLAASFGEVESDATRAAEAANLFSSQMTGGLEKATAALGGARATQGLDKGILSARQSSRLLAEELGIHLPRAVTSAIGEMLPAIGGLGGALLAAFAVREVYEFGEYVKSDSEAVEGLAQAEDRMKEAVKENLAEFKNFTREALQFELNATNLRIGAEERDFQHARRVAENEAALLPYVWHALGIPPT